MSKLSEVKSIENMSIGQKMDNASYYLACLLDDKIDEVEQFEEKIQTEIQFLTKIKTEFLNIRVGMLNTDPNKVSLWEEANTIFETTNYKTDNLRKEIIANFLKISNDLLAEL